MKRYLPVAFLLVGSTNVSADPYSARPVPPDDAPLLDVSQAPAARQLTAGRKSPPLVTGGTWQPAGPFGARFGQVENISPDNMVCGAVHTVAAHPINADILYLGGTGGGVWRTTNATSGSPNWTPLTDGFPSLNIGALEFDPTDATHQTLVAGTGRFSSFNDSAVSFGLLRTTDGGETWTAMEDPDFVNARISGVAPRGNIIVATANPFGTGEGVYRSTDFGVTWTAIDGSNGLPNGAAFDLVGDPNNPNVLYVPMEQNGVYKSVNTGSTWTQIADVDFGGAAPELIGTSTNNMEMAVSQANSDHVFIAVSNAGQAEGILYSTDGGMSWSAMDLPLTPQGSPVPITEATNTSPIIVTSVGHGLGEGRRVDLTGVTGNTAANGTWRVTPVDSDAFELDGSMGNGSYTGGGSYTVLSGLNPRRKPGSQGGIHFSITADPADENIFYVGGDRQEVPFPNYLGAIDFTGRLFRGDISVPPTGGLLSPQWEHLTHSNAIATIPGGGTASGSSPHADSREMVFDAGGDLIQGDDGGIYRRTSPQDNTGDWFSLNGNLQVTEFHSIEYDTLSNVVFGGAQDTGTMYQPTEGAALWDSFSTADGGKVAVDTVTSPGQSIRFTSTQFFIDLIRSVWDSSGNLISFEAPGLIVNGTGGLTLGEVAGLRFYQPVELNRVDPRRGVTGTAFNIYITEDHFDTVDAVPPTDLINFPRAMAYGGYADTIPNPEIMWVSALDGVYVRSSAVSGLNRSTSFPGFFSLDIDMDRDDWETAYAIDNNQIFETTDMGVSWMDITGNLFADFTPQTLRSVVTVPGSTDAIVVGSNNGVYVAFENDSANWLQLGADLPNAPVLDLVYDEADDVLVAGTLGRGAWILSPVLPGNSSGVGDWIAFP